MNEPDPRPIYLPSRHSTRSIEVRGIIVGDAMTLWRKYRLAVWLAPNFRDSDVIFWMPSTAWLMDAMFWLLWPSGRFVP